MASNLRVDTILPSTGTSLGIGTASGTINFLGDSQINTTGVITASNFKTGSTDVHSGGLSLGAGSTIGAVTGVTTYYGDGSQLTGISAGVSVANQSDNRMITCTGTSDTLNAEANLSFSNNQLTVHTAKLKGNQLLFEPAGTAYIDHSTVGQDIQVRVSTSSSNDTTGPTFKSNGNLAFASGKGIDFSATGDGTGSSNRSELLDDYESGQWTGSINSGSANINDPWYVKIGKFVIGGGNITAISDTSSSNSIIVNGLPFSNSGGNSGSGSVSASKNNQFDKMVRCYVSGTTVRFMVSSLSTGSHDYLRHSSVVQSSGSITFGFNYITS